MDKAPCNLKSPRLKRPWLRYSFRSMMLLVAIFALWLGVVVKRAKDQERAVDVILAAGGFVQYDVDMGQSYWAMAPARRSSFKELHSIIPSRWTMKYRNWLRPVVGQHYVDNVVSVGFHRTEAVLANRDDILQQYRERKLIQTDKFNDRSSLPCPERLSLLMTTRCMLSPHGLGIRLGLRNNIISR